MNTAATAAPTASDRRRAHYLFTEDQSADLESFRFALKGLAAIACNDTDGEDNIDGVAEAKVRRSYLQAIFEQLDRRLKEIVGVDRVGCVWLDPEGNATNYRPVPARLGLYD